MKANLVSFTIGKMDATKRRNFQRELYGFKDFSNNGKYVYEREGFVQKTKSKKMDSAILVAQQNTKEIVNILKKYGAKVKMFDVTVKKSVF